jgi:tight adherence protein C
MVADALLLLGGALSLFFLVAAVAVLLRGSQERRVADRLDAIIGTAPAPEATAAVVLPGPRRGRRMATDAVRGHAILSEQDARDIVAMSAAAGLEPRRTLRLFTASKLVLMLLVPAMAYSVALAVRPGMALLAGAVGLMVGLLGPNWVMGSLRSRYLRRRQRGLTEALDLMVVCSEAGLGLESSVERVAREMARSNPGVALEFGTLANELRLLPERRQALARLGERAASEEMQRLTAALNQTLRYGTPLAQAMRTLSADLRRERMSRLEEQATRLPALLVLPLILFIMPCLFVVLVGPSVIILSRTL